MSRAALRQRLTALMQAIRPHGSMAARVDALQPDMRAEYEAWKAAQQRWHDKYPGEDAYAVLLDGRAGPAMSDRLRKALGIETTTIPATASMSDAAAIYQRVKGS